MLRFFESNLQIIKNNNNDADNNNNNANNNDDNTKRTIPVKCIYNNKLNKVMDVVM